MLRASPQAEDNGNGSAPRKKRPYKFRQGHTRSRTGCLTCRNRRRKCDEVKPICGYCARLSLDCAWPPSWQSLETQTPLETVGGRLDAQVTEIADSAAESVSGESFRPAATPSESGESFRPTAPLAQQLHSAPLQANLQQPRRITRLLLKQQQQQQVSGPGGRIATQQHAPPIACHTEDIDTSLQVPQGSLALNCSLDTTDRASTRFGLLTNDATQDNDGLLMALSPGPDDGECHREATTPPLQSGAFNVPELDQSRRPDDTTDLDQERTKWQGDVDVTLDANDASLLRHFVDRCAQWLDLFDPKRSFSTYAVRLAIRNRGLMNAILALAAKHRSVSQGASLGHDANGSVVQNMPQNSEVRNYSESLCYVREALCHDSYKQSEELLVTAMVISAYEMLDGSDGSGDWQRHLKGVFWIQRSQDVNGGSGGIRQAVWWAWLRHDLWAAFREKRACLSFWKPAKDIHELDQNGLAQYAIYLLSQAVNYCTESQKADSTSTMDTVRRRATMDELLNKMDCWELYLGNEFKPLPTPSSPTDVFTPLWVHPPHFGVALQAYSFAQILIALHSPNLAGFNGYLKMQRTLAEAVETICGIAMELKEEGCQILSAQCLYGAGLCVQDPSKREVIMTLMQACEARVGWAPITTWRDDLKVEWSKVDIESTRPR